MRAPSANLIGDFLVFIPSHFLTDALAIHGEVANESEQVIGFMAQAISVDEIPTAGRKDLGVEVHEFTISRTLASWSVSFRIVSS